MVSRARIRPLARVVEVLDSVGPWLDLVPASIADVAADGQQWPKPGNTLSFDQPLSAVPLGHSRVHASSATLEKG